MYKNFLCTSIMGHTLSVILRHIPSGITIKLAIKDGTGVGDWLR